MLVYMLMCRCAYARTCSKQDFPQEEIDAYLHGVSGARLVATHPQSLGGGERFDGDDMHDAGELFGPSRQDPARATGRENAQTKPLREHGGEGGEEVKQGQKQGQDPWQDLR